MAELEKTLNLGIPRILGNQPLVRQQFNGAIDELDKQALSVNHAATKAHFELWKPSTTYKIQDIVRTSTCPSWGFYMCTTPGVSGTSEPQGYGEGDEITDGTCVWKLKLFGGPTSINHGDLKFRNQPDQHSIEAITGLLEALSGKATPADIETAINNLIDGAPEALDTLKEIADVLKNNDDVVAQIINTLATKVDKIEGKGLSTNDYINVDKAKVDKISEVNGKFTYAGKTITGGTTTWRENQNYEIAELVVCDNLLYRCIRAHTSSNFQVDISNWQQLTIGYIPDWQGETQYIVNQVVVRGNSILRCVNSHTSNDFSNTERNSWIVIAGKGASLPIWKSNTEYEIDEAVIYNDVIYRAIVNHISSAAFSSDMIVGNEKWRTVNSGSGSGNVLQVTKLGVIAPKIEELIINYTDTFKLPAVEVLKFEPGAQDQIVTACSFNNSDATDFVYDAEFVEFDGNMRLKTVFDIQMSEQVMLEDMFMQESSIIDLSLYKNVEEVN